MDASVSLDRIKTWNNFWSLGADRYSRLCHNSVICQRLSSVTSIFDQAMSKKTQYQRNALIAVIANLKRILTLTASHYRGESTGLMRCKLFIPSNNTGDCRQQWKVRLINTHTQFNTHSIRKPKFIATGRRSEASATPTKPSESSLALRIYQ